jgi:hypothetical protein
MPDVVQIKTALTTSNLRLHKDDQQLDISGGGNLKVVSRFERAKTESNFICTARGNSTPPTELAADLIGNDPGPRLMDYLRDTELNFFIITSPGLSGRSCGDGHESP